MGNQPMPTVAEFLRIEPLTPEMVRQIGYLPQCLYRPRACGNMTEWTVEGDHYCTVHKDEIVLKWKGMIAEWIARPAEAQDSDLELLEIVRDELESRSGELYPSVAVGRVIKDLSLPDTEAGRSLASWYLWEMEIFSIHNRVRYFEAAA